MISEKSRTATVLFAFFFGVLGIHRFYVGKVSTGVVMLLLSITYIGLIFTGIWALIDFIVALCGGFRDIEGKRVKTW